MPLEYEYKFINYDKNSIISKIKKLGGKKIGHYIFKVMILSHPLKKEGTYIRVRDEGHKITMTYKITGKSEFLEEHEVIINDFDEGINILLGIGCTKKYYYEKIREVWNIKKSEIVFDITPAHPEFMEVESPTKKQLDETVKLLELTEDDKMGNLAKILSDKFGLVLPLPGDLEFTFDNIGKISKYVTKNKNEFNKLAKEQKILYKKLSTV